MKNLYLIVGRSGSGKTTLVELLNKQYGLIPVASYTTRPPRYEGETGHTFISKEEFDQKDMLAYTLFDQYEYGVDAKLLSNSDLYVIDIAGVKLLKEKYHDKRLFVFNLLTSEDVLIKRMHDRGDSEDKIIQRLKNDNQMFEEERNFKFDGVVDANLPISRVADTIMEFIKICEEL